MIPQHLPVDCDERVRVDLEGRWQRVRSRLRLALVVLPSVQLVIALVGLGLLTFGAGERGLGALVIGALCCLPVGLILVRIRRGLVIPKVSEWTSAGLLPTLVTAALAAIALLGSADLRDNRGLASVLLIAAILVPVPVFAAARGAVGLLLSAPLALAGRSGFALTTRLRVRRFRDAHVHLEADRVRWVVQVIRQHGARTVASGHLPLSELQSASTSTTENPVIDARLGRGVVARPGPVLVLRAAHRTVALTVGNASEFAELCQQRSDWLHGRQDRTPP
ncbi:hypothetical protein [Actinoalloteichus hymeniacidonis]|uniref:hypothetical protein n=1 Tax=Actinoalloteichus hymeniacidonis TaxID=340345 RepID=UPI0012FC39E9|nr:hypothetical protein [Actinoalloteichus hymeniacidonis]MBB5906980.1 hypothetical protein [Actinoalloteichus hymeniacidonis]